MPEICPTCNRPLDEVPEGWEEFEDVREEVVRLELNDLLSPEFWRQVHNLTEGTRVYYLDELRKYATWLSTKPAHSKHKNLKRGFLNWLKTALGRDDYRKLKEAGLA